MDEKEFSTQLNRCKVSRGADHFNDHKAKSWGSASQQQQPKKVKTQTVIKTAQETTSTPASFWEQLEVYLISKGLAKEDARKLCASAKEQFEQKKNAKPKDGGLDLD